MKTSKRIGEIMMATICDTGIEVTGTDRDDVADKIAQILAKQYRETGNDAWLYAEAVDDRGVFTVEIEGDDHRHE